MAAKKPKSVGSLVEKARQHALEKQKPAWWLKLNRSQQTALKELREARRSGELDVSACELYRIAVKEFGKFTSERSFQRFMTEEAGWIDG